MIVAKQRGFFQVFVNHNRRASFGGRDKFLLDFNRPRKQPANFADLLKVGGRGRNLDALGAVGYSERLEKLAGAVGAVSAQAAVAGQVEGGAVNYDVGGVVDLGGERAACGGSEIVGHG